MSAYEALRGLFHEAFEAVTLDLEYFAEHASEVYAEAGSSAACGGYSDPWAWANEAVRHLKRPADPFAVEREIMTGLIVDRMAAERAAARDAKYDDDSLPF